MTYHEAVGWTIFDKLYIFKGVVYIVSDEPSTVPDLRFIFSNGMMISPGTEAELERLPTDEDIQVISTKQAKKLFGSTGAEIMDGVSVRRPSFNSYLVLPFSLNSSLSMTLPNCS